MKVFIATLNASSSTAGVRGRGHASRRTLRASPAFGGWRGRHRDIRARVLVTTAVVCWRRSVFSGGLPREWLRTKVSEHVHGVEREPEVFKRKVPAREVTLALVRVILAALLVVRDSRGQHFPYLSPTLS